jgi:type I restriction enzyme S subunit
MSEWKEIFLRDVCTEISYGYTASATHQNTGVKFLRITDIVNTPFNWDTVPYCEISTKDTEKYKLYPGDIVIARTGATTGTTFTITDETKAVFASYLIRYKIDKTKANPYFIGHNLKSEQWKGYVENIIGGSAQPGANAQQFADYELLLPPLPEQERIAEVLSSLDDKIDLLHRQNKTLEEMAETLFRQWFVEEAEEDSNSYICLSELVDTISETHKFLKGGAIFLNTSDIYQGAFLTNQFVNKEILPGQAKKSIKKGDILFSEIRPSNGRWAFVDFTSDDYVVSTKLMVIRSKGRVSPEFIYFYLTHKTTVDYLQMIAESRSGTFPQITFEQIKPLKIKVPAEKILKEAELWCKSVLDKILFNKKQIQQLETLRDTLLPKLMSGAVNIEK